MYPTRAGQVQRAHVGANSDQQWRRDDGHHAGDHKGNRPIQIENHREDDR